jgi:hypothetical protein
VSQLRVGETGSVDGADPGTKHGNCRNPNREGTRCAFRLEAASIQTADPGASLLASDAIKAPRCREHGLGSVPSPEAIVTRNARKRGLRAEMLEASGRRRNALWSTCLAVVTQRWSCSSHVSVDENLRRGRTQAGEVWAANEAHAVHRNTDPGLVAVGCGRSDTHDGG